MKVGDRLAYVVIFAFAFSGLLEAAWAAVTILWAEAWWHYLVALALFLQGATYLSAAVNGYRGIKTARKREVLLALQD